MQKLTNIKVIFIDIDGTLTNSKKEVTKFTSDTIKKITDKGILTVICSGRGNKYVEKKAKEANTSQYIITSNGAQIYDCKNQVSLYEKSINEKTLKSIIEYTNKNKIGCIINCPTIRYSNKYLKRMMDPEEKKFSSFSDIHENTFLQLVIETNNYNLMQEVIEYIKTYKDLNILNVSHNYINNIKTDDKYYIDINNVDVNKGNAIKKFLEIFKLKKENSLCFGDHINDTAMFSSCVYKVAMENGNEELKKKADYVTLTNDENGVADFINKYIL